MKGARAGLFWLTFLESFGTILLERGLYFYTHDLLGFSETQNLWLALAFGVTYVMGALLSHRASDRWGEKRLLSVSLFALLLAHGALGLVPESWLLMAAFPTIGFLQGIKWPVVESFVSAGRTPSELLPVIGRYNSTWALAVPLAMAASGPLIASRFPGLLFALAGVLNILALGLATRLDARPVHLDHAHPARPGSAELRRLGALLISARWSMLLSYALLFLLAPLMPAVFVRLGLGVAEATSAAGFLDVARLVCFVALGALHGWRGRTLPLVLSIIGLPVSFVLILFGHTLSVVLFGELLYGITAGYTYTAALYYALVVKNASVDAGGAHESLIGLGFVLGPLAGIVAGAATPGLGSSVIATLLSIAPLALVCTVLGLRPLRTSN